MATSPLRLARLPLFLTIAGAILSGACADGGATGGPALDADRLPTLRLEEERRLGSVDDPDLGFSRITRVRTAADGHLFVGEGQDRQIRVYDAEGRLVRRIGRQGQGPGELMAVSAFGLAGDTLWVSDVQGRRITFFTTGGELLATIPATGIEIPVAAGNLFRVEVRPLERLADGRFSTMMNISSFGGGPSESYPLPEVVFDPTGTRVDTLAFRVVEPTPSVRVADRDVTIPPPIRDEPLVSWLGADSVIVRRPFAADGSRGTFTVTQVGPAHDTLFHRTFHYQPVPVSRSQRESLVAARIAFPIRSGFPGDTAALRRAVESQMFIPAYHPPVSSVVRGADGSVWLRREDDGGEDVWRWILLGTDGEPRGQITLPRSATLHWSDGDRVWTVELDDLEVPWLVSYRLREG